MPHSSSLIFRSANVEIDHPNFLSLALAYDRSKEDHWTTSSPLIDLRLKFRFALSLDLNEITLCFCRGRLAMKGGSTTVVVQVLG